MGSAHDLEVAVPRCLGPVRDTNLRERRPARSLGQRSDLSRGRARGGPEQLIKMATGQLPELPAAANGDTCGDKQRLGLSRLSRLGANAASRVLRGAYAEWTVNLFSQGRVI